MAKKNSEKELAPSGFQPNLRVLPGAGPNGGDLPEYITPERSGLESGFYVESRGLPWHVSLSRRLNTPELMQGAAEKVTVAQALSLGGLDWEVGTAEVRAMVPGVQDGLTLFGRVATYRKDTGAVLGTDTMSTAYKVVQNADAFAFADYILDTPGAHCESAGSLFGGRWVFLSMELPDEVHVDGDESPFRLFLVVSNGHDGKHPLRVDITVERVVCRNTLRIAQKGARQSWAIRHTSGIEGRVQEARQALRLSHRYAEAFSESASRLTSLSLAERQVDDILARLFPLTEAQAERVEKDPTVLDRLPVGVVRAVYEQSPTVQRGTAWGVLNAVSEWADHFQKFRPVTLGGADEQRARILLEQPRDVKQQAWDLLLEAAR